MLNNIGYLLLNVNVYFTCNDLDKCLQVYLLLTQVFSRVQNNWCNESIMAKAMIHPMIYKSQDRKQKTQE